MKKSNSNLYLAFFILLNLALLSSCAKQKIENIDVTDGAIYSLIEGTVGNVKKVYAKTENGTNIPGEILDNKFRVSIPNLSVKQDVKLFFENNKKEIIQNVTINALAPIDSYEDFSKKMNLNNKTVNSDSKTVYPDNYRNGIYDVSIENGVTTSLNIYNNNVIGLQMITTGDVNQEVATNLVSIQQIYASIDDRVAEAYNNTLNTKERNEFTINDIKFVFEYNDNKLFVEVFKT